MTPSAATPSLPLRTLRFADGGAAAPTPSRRSEPLARAVRLEQLAQATADLDPTFAVLDLDALHANALAMRERAAGTPIRVASKSVRCRAVLDAVLALEGYHGVLALTLGEALWLASGPAPIEDVVVGYPSADRAALRHLAADPDLAARVTIMVDDVAQLAFIEREVGTPARPLRVCLDIDASLELLGGRVHLGALRSPVHSVAQAEALAREVVRRDGFELVGLMSYEGQIAGLGDAAGSRLTQVQIRAMQRVSVRELAARRAAIVAAVRAIAPLEFVNGGGTGSLETTSAEDAVTEIAAGSGLYSPALFDHYRAFRHLPATFFVTSVVRRPDAATATVAGGGWPASGAAGVDRLPTPCWPPGLRLTPREGAGEAQTPLVGPGARGLAVGDRVWFRHPKAGEICERTDTLHVVSGEQLLGGVPTYRGEGKALL